MANRLAVPLLVLGVACGANSATQDPVELIEHVDPFIGTGGLGFGVGSAYPGPAMPFAMIHPGPDTRSSAGAPGFSHCAGYWYEDPMIAGFSLTRMHGTGAPDYGVISYMPVDGMNDSFRAGLAYSAEFSHDDEEASPGYYRVTLRSGIQVEITSTRRAAVLRFQFPEHVDPVLLLDLEHTLDGGSSGGGSIDIDVATGRIDGMMHNNGDLSSRFGGFDVFSAGFVDPLPIGGGVWDDAGLRETDSAATGTDIGGWVRFAPGTREAQLRVAISFVDQAGAARNLAEEIPRFEFDAVKTAARDVWREELLAVSIEGVDPVDATILATALYHSLLMPTLISDVDGRAREVDDEIVTVDRPRYSDFSLWDTYRTLHPWLLLREDARNVDFAQSLTAFARKQGAFPRWALAHSDVGSMIGSPADIVMAEMAVKGVPFDEEAAYAVSRATALNTNPGELGRRRDVDRYLELGYVPNEAGGGSVARTLEFGAADWATAMWARRLGHDADASMLEQHARGWRHLFHADSGFIRPRNADGSWAPWRGPTQEHESYTEGNAWQYLWMLPHDLDGLADALGGRDAALAKLDELFAESVAEPETIGPRLYYWHGNEPDLIAPWAYAAWGEPARAVQWVDWIVNDAYSSGPDGLAGNDDGGTLSAWLLFASAGIYPIAGTDRYLVAAPRQRTMVLHRPSGELRIEAEPDPRTHPVPVSVALDGVTVEGELRHDQLVGDHVLRFEMAKN